MNVLFYISGAVAIISSLIVITRRSAMHALVNLVVAFLAIACAFWTLGAPFAAALQIVVYAGAIMVLFVFAVMILNVQPARRMGSLKEHLVMWVIPALFAAVLLAELVIVLVGAHAGASRGVVGPVAVGQSLYTGYALGVEIASVMLLAGLVAAFHYGVIPGRVEVEDE